MAPINTRCTLTLKEKREDILAKRAAKAKANAPKGMVELAKESRKKSSTRTQTTLTEGFKTIKVKQELLKKTGGDAYTQDQGKDKEGNSNAKATTKVDWMELEQQEDDEIEIIEAEEAKNNAKEDEIISTSDEEMEQSEEEGMVEEYDEDIYSSPVNKGKRKADVENKGEAKSPIRKTNKSPNKTTLNAMLPPVIRKMAGLGTTVTPDRRKEEGEQQKEQDTKKKATKQVTMQTYASKAKGTKREPHEGMIRLRFRYNAPKDSKSTKPPISDLLYTLVETARELDKDSMIMPWDDSSENLGPLKLQDFNYANKVTLGDMKKYLDLPFDVKTQGFTPGRTEYQLGVRFTTTLEVRTFKNAWDLQKKDRLDSKKKFVAMKLAEHQTSPRAYLIGVAAGSTENMEFKSINEGLQKATGIQGIAVNYQTFHQTGITKPMWNIAYKKADTASTDKRSRAHNKTKYAWAPEGLCVFVTDKTLEKSARMKMLELYGECTEDGTLPVWPGGSAMRFIPLKATFIKNAKTRTKVEKRIKFHIYQKVEEVEIPTSFNNIYESIEKFNGKSFQEIIMQIESKEVQGLRLFRHFNHVWDREPSKRKWAISTHTKLHEEAIAKINGLKSELENKYGKEVSKFFEEAAPRRSFYADRGKTIEEEEEDDWFKDSDIISEKEKSIFVEGITEAMFETQMNGTDAPSWGSAMSNLSPTGETMASTSTLTRSTVTVTDAQVEQRKQDLVQTLSTKGVAKATIQQMIEGTTPYDIVSGVFKTDEYTHDGMVTLLCNLQMAFASLPKGIDEKDKEVEQKSENNTIDLSTQCAEGAQKVK